MKRAKTEKSKDPRLDVPLTASDAVRISCEDCGHLGFLDQERLSELEKAGCRTFGDLGRRLKCWDCFGAGGLGKNISLEMICDDPKQKVIRQLHGLT